MRVCQNLRFVALVPEGTGGLSCGHLRKLAGIVALAPLCPVGHLVSGQHSCSDIELGCAGLDRFQPRTAALAPAASPIYCNPGELGTIAVCHARPNSRLNFNRTDKTGYCDAKHVWCRCF